MNFMTAEHDGQFVDTNVLVYAYDVTAGKKREKAKNLLSTLWQSGEGSLSIQVLQEFYVTVTQKLFPPIPIDNAAQILADFAQWRVYAPKPADLVAAIELQRRYQLSFWDAMIVLAARRLHCRKIWSEDLTDGAVYDGIAICNPFAESMQVQERPRGYDFALPES